MLMPGDEESVGWDDSLFRKWQFLLEWKDADQILVFFGRAWRYMAF